MIRRLITVGALVTVVGGALSAALFMGWDWRLSVSFGALVIVTGPTVIGPLLRRIKVTHKVETVLEAEGVLIDADRRDPGRRDPRDRDQRLGGLAGRGRCWAWWRGSGFGVAAGLVAGWIMVVPARGGGTSFRRVSRTSSRCRWCWPPSSSATLVMHESGILTATVAGMVVGNRGTRVRRDLMEFKEQLTVLFIGLLFVLLAADVRVAQVLELGLPGLLTVASLMLSSGR